MTARTEVGSVNVAELILCDVSKMALLSHFPRTELFQGDQKLGGPQVRDWAEWQKPYVNGVVLIWPPAEIRSYINPLREKYDSKSQSYSEAHVSLTPPFRNPPTDHDWQTLESAAKQFASFDITLGPAEGWLSQSVIYLEVRPVEQLLKLRDGLLETQLFGEPSFRSFVPHMTITEGLSGIPVTAELLVMLHKTIQVRSFYCDHLTYLRPDASFSFRAERSIALGRWKL